MITVSIIEDDKHYREGLETLINGSGHFTVLNSYSSAEIADRLFLNNHTVTKHLKNIYHKLHVNNRVEAVNRLNHPGE